ncbi:MULTISPECIES: DNA polymerase III subunit delta [unclassified Moraxella]|uniref:DNA polymerase III subunit delta n=1 Tax=unclassified Moraxella TaxID=2685852 RepID=UPI003AF7C112
MNHAFLTAFNHAKTLSHPATGLWLLHGDEDLLAQWLIERLQPQWQAHGMAVQRMDIVSAKSWQEVLAELNSLSLFDDSKVIIAQGNHKPDKDSLAQLQDFATQNPTNCLIIISDKYDKKAQTSAFFQLCDKHGQVVDCHLYQESQREALLKQHAQDFGIDLHTEAWQMLMAQTQNNLLTAYQTLWRLSYLYAPTPNQALVRIDTQQLQDGLVNQSHFTTFDLSDAMLMGDVAKVVTILQALKHAEEPESLVLWVIAKDMRNVQSLLTGASFQSLGIWSSKQGLYNQAVRRHTPQTTHDWANLLYDCDRAIKGLSQTPAWELLYQTALALAGVRLFYQQILGVYNTPLQNLSYCQFK